MAERIAYEIDRCASSDSVPAGERAFKVASVRARVSSLASAERSSLS
jgi:hypothetical protein